MKNTRYKNQDDDPNDYHVRYALDVARISQMREQSELLQKSGIRKISFEYHPTCQILINDGAFSEDDYTKLESEILKMTILCVDMFGETEMGEAYPSKMTIRLDANTLSHTYAREVTKAEYRTKEEMF